VGIVTIDVLRARRPTASSAAGRDARNTAGRPGCAAEPTHSIGHCRHGQPIRQPRRQFACGPDSSAEPLSDRWAARAIGVFRSLRAAL